MVAVALPSSMMTDATQIAPQDTQAPPTQHARPQLRGDRSDKSGPDAGLILAVVISLPLWGGVFVAGRLVIAAL